MNYHTWVLYIGVLLAFFCIGKISVDVMHIKEDVKNLGETVCYRED